MPTKVKTVNFGSAKTGLSTVGYQLYKYTNGAFAADGSRVTTGVDEIGSTGIYGANIDIAEKYTGVLVWDTGEGTPRYGVDDLDDEHLMSDTQLIKTIRNTIQNQANYAAEIASRLKQGVLDPNDPVMGSLRTAIAGIDSKIASKDEIVEAMQVAASKVNLATTGPDMTEVIDAVRIELNTLPKPQGLTQAQFAKQMNGILRDLKKWMSDTNRLLLDQRLSAVSKPRDVANAMDVMTRRTSDLLSSAVNDMVARIKGLSDEEADALGKKILGVNENLNAHVSSTRASNSELQDLKQKVDAAARSVASLSETLAELVKQLQTTTNTLQINQLLQGEDRSKNARLLKGMVS